MTVIVQPWGLVFNGERPLYWLNEVSGRMRRIVMAFLNNETLSTEEFGVLKWYICQWIEVMSYKPGGYKDTIDKMDQIGLKGYIVYELVSKYGIDPF